MPLRVNPYNFTDRGSSTSHNDTYRGKSNATYQSSSNIDLNEGFASVRASFPSGSFATCRYPDLTEPNLKRQPHENTWHLFESEAEAKANAPGTPFDLNASPHNMSGTKPLPIPFSQRPGFEEEQRRLAEEKRRRYEAFKSQRISSAGDHIPPDFYDHTQTSETHIQTMLNAGQTYRPSKPRVGTTPAERAKAEQELRQKQDRLAREYALQEQRTAASSSSSQASRQGAGGQQQQEETVFLPASGYNIPVRAQPQ